MDGAYALRHKKREGRATIALAGTELTTQIPPEPEKRQHFATHAAALEAMNAALVRLTGQGWTLVDVESARSHADDESDREATAREEAPPEVEDLVAEIVLRSGPRVTIDVRAADVDGVQAEGVLREALRDGCRELVLQDAQPYVEPWWQTVHPWCAALAKVGGPALELFVVDTYFQPLTRQATVCCGDVTAVFAACPSLVRAHVIGAATLDALAHERLEDLTLMSDPMETGTLAAVLRGPLPKLARLAVGLSYERAAADGIDDVLLDSVREATLPSLRELHVAFPCNPERVLRGLVAAPIFGQLEVLSIQGDWRDLDEALALLREHRDALGKLRELRLPLADLEEEIEAAGSAIPGLRDIEGNDAFGPSRYRDD